MCILSALCQRSKTNELTSAVGSDVGYDKTTMSRIIVWISLYLMDLHLHQLTFAEGALEGDDVGCNNTMPKSYNMSCNWHGNRGALNITWNPPYLS